MPKKHSSKKPLDNKKKTARGQKKTPSDKKHTRHGKQKALRGDLQRLTTARQATPSQQHGEQQEDDADFRAAQVEGWKALGGVIRARTAGQRALERPSPSSPQEIDELFLGLKRLLDAHVSAAILAGQTERPSCSDMQRTTAWAEEEMLYNAVEQYMAYLHDWATGLLGEFTIPSDAFPEPDYRLLTACTHSLGSGCLHCRCSECGTRAIRAVAGEGKVPLRIPVSHPSIREAIAARAASHRPSTVPDSSKLHNPSPTS